MWTCKYLFKTLLQFFRIYTQKWNCCFIPLSFWGPTTVFSIAAAHFTFPPPVHKPSNFSRPSEELGTGPSKFDMKAGHLSETVQETAGDTDHDSGDRMVLLTDLEFIQQEMREATKDKWVCWWQWRGESWRWGTVQWGGTLFHKRQQLIVFKKFILLS